MTLIKINNISINYKLEGEGKRIVFVHGLSDSLKYWNIISLELKEKYQVLSFDLRGHGKSTDEDKKTTIDLYHEDLYQLLNALNIDDAVFIGFSLGGNVILDFAIKHPEMVNGLIVMSSFPEHTGELEKVFDEFREAIDKGFVEFYDVIIPYVLPKDILEENREILEGIKYEGAKVANVEGIRKGIEAGYDFNITDELSQINTPTLVLAGRDDDLTNLEIQKKISDNIEDSKLIVFDNTKHNLLIGRNITEILKIIDEFMSKIDN